MLGHAVAHTSCQTMGCHWSLQAMTWIRPNQSLKARKVLCLSTLTSVCFLQTLRAWVFFDRSNITQYNVCNYSNLKWQASLTTCCHNLNSTLHDASSWESNHICSAYLTSQVSTPFLPQSQGDGTKLYYLGIVQKDIHTRAASIINNAQVPQELTGNIIS